MIEHYRTQFVTPLKNISAGAAYEDYLRAWDALPNAQVYTGAYCQDIFATSDDYRRLNGMSATDFICKTITDKLH